MENETIKIKNEITKNKNWNKIRNIVKNITTKDKESLEIRQERCLIILDLLNNKKYTLLGIGASRMTININGFAIKISIKEMGDMHNYNEKSFWDHLKLSHTNYFTECFHVEDGFGIYKLVDTFQKGDVLIYCDKMSDILDDLSQYYIVKDNWRDNRKNWGLYESKPIIFDYANIYPIIE